LPSVEGFLAKGDFYNDIELLVYLGVSLSLAELIKKVFEQQHVEVLNRRRWVNLTPKFPMG